MAGAAPAGAEVARRVGAAGGARTPSPGRERLQSNPVDESAFRPTWPDECGIGPAASGSMRAGAPLDGAAGGGSRPSPAPDECASRPTGQTSFVQPARTNVA